jgi:hypothetical protein
MSTIILTSIQLASCLVAKSITSISLGVLMVKQLQERKNNFTIALLLSLCPTALGIISQIISIPWVLLVYVDSLGNALASYILGVVAGVLFNVGGAAVTVSLILRFASAETVMEGTLALKKQKTRQKDTLIVVTVILCCLSIIGSCFPTYGSYVDLITSFMVVVFLIWVVICNNYLNIRLVTRTIEATRKDLEIEQAIAGTDKDLSNSQALTGLKRQLVVGYSFLIILDVLLIILYAVGKFLSADVSFTLTHICMSLAWWHVVICVQLLRLFKNQIIKRATAVKSSSLSPSSDIQSVRRNSFFINKK